jgi:2-phosphosulfolactate phosphatase
MGAFQHAKPNISELLWECGSGRELRARGFENDVRHCSLLDIFQVVPRLYHDHFVDVFRSNA